MSALASQATAAPMALAAAGQGRIPSLDGLRAVSILAVIVGHAIETAPRGPGLQALQHAGNLGVRVFFVISGCLITHLLMKEWRRTGTISLRDFYIRRTIRIWPAMYFYIAVVAVLAWFGRAEIGERDLLHAVTFTMNYHHQREWPLNHLWSLSVEEQFYLLWPGVVVLAGLARARWVCLAVILLVPFIRLAMWRFLEMPAPSPMTREFQAVADSLAVGCGLALVRDALEARPGYMRFVSSLLAPAVALLVMGASFAIALKSPGLFYVWLQSATNVAIALLLHHALVAPGSAVGRVLNVRPMIFVGVISYSLYLWQELFLDPYSREWFAQFPQNVPLTFIAGYLSYRVIEQPFNGLRRRFSHVA